MNGRPSWLIKEHCTFCMLYRIFFPFCLLFLKIYVITFTIVTIDVNSRWLTSVKVVVVINVVVFVLDISMATTPRSLANGTGRKPLTLIPPDAAVNDLCSISNASFYEYHSFLFPPPSPEASCRSLISPMRSIVFLYKSFPIRFSLFVNILF